MYVYTLISRTDETSARDTLTNVQRPPDQRERRAQQTCAHAFYYDPERELTRAKRVLGTVSNEQLLAERRSDD